MSIRSIRASQRLEVPPRCANAQSIIASMPGYRGHELQRCPGKSNDRHHGIDENLNQIKARLSDVIHGCMMSALVIPKDKRAHRFIPMDRSDFYYPGDRSDAYTVIEINMMIGREVETKIEADQAVVRAHRM